MRKHFPVSHTIKRAAALLLAAALLTSGAACKKRDPTAATRPADVSASAAAAAKTTEAETSAKEKAAEKITQELTKPAEAGKTEETAAAVSEEEKKKVQEEFDEFCDRIFAESLETNLLTTHFLLEHPETYGIDISEPAYPDVSPTTKEEDIEELEPDLGIPPAKTGSLIPWAEEGVLLLNNVLTVYGGEANSHKGWGWEEFTARLLLALQGQPRPIAFLLWGKGAQTKGQAARIMDSPYPRLIIETAHPSPLSARRGFFGSKPFSRVNQFLEEHGETPICWAVER